MTKFAEIQDAFNEIRDNQDQSRSGYLFRQWHGCCEEFADWLLSRLIKERARVLELSHIGDTSRPTRFRGGKKEPNPYYHWTPADWEREAEKGLREEP